MVLLPFYAYEGDSNEMSIYHRNNQIRKKFSAVYVILFFFFFSVTNQILSDLDYLISWNVST